MADLTPLELAMAAAEAAEKAAEVARAAAEALREGEPGLPGEKGLPPGGAGGQGGRGGQEGVGLTGRQGPEGMPGIEGRRGPVGRLSVIGYLILTVGIVFLFWLQAEDRSQARAAAAAQRIEMCHEIEKLKTQNREDLANERKNFKSDIALFHIELTPKLLTRVYRDWHMRADRNQPLACPYAIP